MKIRAITVGIHLDFGIFEDKHALEARITKAASIARAIEAVLREHQYTVQTIRVTLPPMESWLRLDGAEVGVLRLLECLKQNNISFCSLGGCSTAEYISILPQLLAISDTLSCSVMFQSNASDLLISPNYDLCLAAAYASLELFKSCGNLGNFRFCTSFNMVKPTPFFPASSCNLKKIGDEEEYSVSIGLENGDLLFLAFFAAESVEAGSKVLTNVLAQAMQPIQELIVTTCANLSNSVLNTIVSFSGIDASLNPGLSLQDSVGAGLEHLLLPRPQKFGCFGTLAAVSAITTSVKSTALAVNGSNISLTGYSGLMLPVMEDIILAQRATEGTYTLRDLLLFSSVCGVGLDTVPVPGNITAEELARIYLETGALAFRLNKPLSCRLLPMSGLVPGDLTSIESPYLCNTTVFRL